MKGAFISYRRYDIQHNNARHNDRGLIVMLSDVVFVFLSKVNCLLIMKLIHVAVMKCRRLVMLVFTTMHYESRS
jgi:hypothetical protein